ncbi:MAG: hypothetical protein ACXACR_14945 [Candidatus Hodarchaeales archaeon]
MFKKLFLILICLLFSFGNLFAQEACEQKNVTPTGWYYCNGARMVTIVDENRDLVTNSEGRLDVVQHSHPNNGIIHFHIEDVDTTSRFILIDVSDITNYPHDSNTYIHLEDLDVQIDAAAAASYEIELVFLENVDATDGDEYMVWHTSGTKQTGQNKEIYLNWYPNGPRCRSLSVATHSISLNNVNYQTDVNMRTVLDPTTADTSPGAGDIILVITIAAGSINCSVNLSYHAH